MREWWARYQEQRARQYPERHSTLVLDVLRRDPEISARALESFFQIDAATGQPQRTTSEYPSLSYGGFRGNIPGAKALPKSASWQLRRFSEVPCARRSINAFSNPILDLDWKIAVRRPLDMQPHDEQPPPTAEQQRKIRMLTDMFERPNNAACWREFLEEELEDILTLGGAVMEIQENTSDGRPLFLWPVDCQSVRININWYPGSSEFRYSQGRGYLFGAIGTTDEIKLDDDEMLYIRLNPRSHTPFGLGYLEIAMETVNAFLGAFDFATRRASNSTPPFALFLGENVTLDQVRQWQHYWETDVEGYGKTPILGGGRAPSVLNMMSSGEDPLWLKWQEWLVRLVAMSFGLSPMRLGLERDINRSTAEQGASDDWSTIAPVANALRDGLTYGLIWKRLGWTDLEFQWDVKTSDELRQAEILAEQYVMNAITVDEIRQSYQRPPLPDGLGAYTKTAYETAVKAAMMPQPVGPGGSPSDDSGLPHAPAVKVPTVTGAGESWLTPFDDEIDNLSPKEAAFLRELMKEARHSRNGHAASVG